MQDDGQEFLQACTNELWDIAEALVNSGSMLEAQDKVINVIVLRLSKYLTLLCNDHASEISASEISAS